jgi:hypothetical protein
MVTPYIMGLREYITIIAKHGQLAGVCVYIYSLYIKSPELPIIEEAQVSQYALLVEPDLVSIYTVTVAVSLYLS